MADDISPLKGPNDLSELLEDGFDEKGEKAARRIFKKKG